MLAAAVGDGLLGGVSGTWVNRGQGPQNWGNESTPSIALSSVGDKLVAVASDDNIFLSTDYGVTWGNQTTPVATQKWGSVASNSDGTKLAAVVGPIGNIWLSTNSGVDWIEVAAATGPLSLLLLHQIKTGVPSPQTATVPS